MKSRYRLLVLFLGGISLLWAVYLFWIQILDPYQLGSFRRRRYIPNREILIPKRGAILDANGELLVSSISYYQLDVDRASVNRWATRKDIPLQEAYTLIADQISENSDITHEQVMSKLNRNKKLSSIVVSNRIRESELEAIISAFEVQKLPGLIHSFSSMHRIYSKGKLAGRLLGAVAEKSNGFDEETASRSLYQLAGMTGIEATYDRILGGTYGWREIVLDANQERVPYPNLRHKNPADGRNVKLTIDANIQEIVENTLLEGVEKYSASNAGCIIMDPNTGRILAMAGISHDDRSTDPNVIRNSPNIAASFMFEPGSTMKPLTMLPALDSGILRYNQRIICGPKVMPNGRFINDGHIHAGAALLPRDIIAKSSNTGAAEIATLLGAPRLYEQFISYGFGQKSGLNLFGESSGLFQKLENWDSYTLQSISFGQGISVSAIQLAAAYSTIANGGRYMKPYILDSVLDDKGNVLEHYEPRVLRELSSPAATDSMCAYLQAVVDYGTGRHIKMDYIRVGGKTGTAQKNLPGTRGYASGKYTSVFAGLFPVENPQMVIVTFYDEPAPGYHYGSTSAAPTTKSIIENILFMPNCSILPYNEQLRQSTQIMPSLVGRGMLEAERLLNQAGFSYSIEGPDSASVVVDQFPKAGVSVDRYHPITVKLGRGNSPNHAPVAQNVMPDLRGMTIRAAMQLARRHRVPILVQGSGIVRSQSILPGSRITGNTACSLEATL